MTPLLDRYASSMTSVTINTERNNVTIKTERNNRKTKQMSIWSTGNRRVAVCESEGLLIRIRGSRVGGLLIPSKPEGLLTFVVHGT